MKSLEQLDAQPLPEYGVSALPTRSLDSLLRRRSPPHLWFSMRRLPALYTVDRRARFGSDVTQVFLRALMYSTWLDQHSSMETFYSLVDAESLERFGVALCEAWRDGPRRPEMLWALQCLRLIGGLRALFTVHEHLLEAIPEEDDELDAWLKVFWYDDLFGLSFLHRYVHHDNPRLVAAVSQLLEREAQRVPDHTHAQTRRVRQWDQLVLASRFLDISEDTLTLTSERERIALTFDICGGVALDALTTELSDEAMWTITLVEQLIAHHRFLTHEAFEAQQRWDVASWRSLFVHEPTIARWSRGIIWAEFDGRDLCGTYRVAEDATLADEHDEPYILDEGSELSMAHSSVLTPELLVKWGVVLSEYEVVSPILQLSELACERWDREALEQFWLKACHGKITSKEALCAQGWRAAPEGRDVVWGKSVRLATGRYFLRLRLTFTSWAISHVGVLSQPGYSSGTIMLALFDDRELKMLVNEVMQVIAF